MELREPGAGNGGEEAEGEEILGVQGGAATHKRLMVLVPEPGDPKAPHRPEEHGRGEPVDGDVQGADHCRNETGNQVAPLCRNGLPPWKSRASTVPPDFRKVVKYEGWMA